MNKYFKKLFADARHTLETIEKVNKDIVVKDPYQTKVEYTKEWRKQYREVLLNRYCPERKCPLCKCIKLKSRQWVIVENEHLVNLKKTNRIVLLDKLEGHRAICLSCFRRFKI